MQSLMKDAGVQGFAMPVLSHDATEGKAYAIQCATAVVCMWYVVCGL